MYNGTPPLQQAARDVAVVTRLLYPVMEQVRRGEHLSVKQIAQEAGVEEEDARRTLFALEAVGLVESTHYRVTGEGRRAK